MKSIIVATDFSKSGDNAIRYAVNTAYRSGARLVLLTLYNPSLFAFNASVSAASADVRLAMQIKRLAAAKEIIANTYALPVEFHLISGDFIRDVRQYVDLYSANTLVIGMATNALEKDLLAHVPTTEQSSKLSIEALSAKNCFGVNRIYFSPEILHEIQYNLSVKIKNFARELGATVGHFQI
ncbi:universal stress protein [Dyadobacter sp. LHD-138]|uniref:universal stress protein n=1 Tax=Dyadobacter sp. LHD-138 TaxID=3071413 RepID=UPI0027E103D1|nr:universal stress protein [Dyadobacter sp. LHD-138]MDQ6477200.1 universal stress protein [Dyadobacter sp. LHD-138]